VCVCITSQKSSIHSEFVFNRTFDRAQTFANVVASQRAVRSLRFTV